MTLVELCQHTGVYGGIGSAIYYANTHDIGYLWGAGLVVAAVPAGILAGTLLALLLIGLMSLGQRDRSEDRGEDSHHGP